MYIYMSIFSSPGVNPVLSSGCDMAVQVFAFRSVVSKIVNHLQFIFASQSNSSITNLIDNNI